MSHLGFDSDPGTAAKPWKTFGFAVPHLRPGDTLTLADGKYTRETTGLLNVDCASGASHGLPFAPITVRAANERSAWLDTGGTGAGVRVENCSYWRVLGLHVSGADNDAGAEAPLVNANAVDHVAFERMLVDKNNRYTNSHLMEVVSSDHVLVDESEFYDFHRNGMTLVRSHNCTVRRSYFNSRGRADIADGGSGSWSPTHGDEAIELFADNTGHRIENCIFEGQEYGVGAGAIPEPDQPMTRSIRVLGSMSLDEGSGANFSAGSDGSTMPLDIVFRDFVAVHSSTDGLYLGSTKAGWCDHCTFVGSGEGFRAEIDPGNPGDGVGTVRVDDSLALGNGNSGFVFDSRLDLWEARNVDAWGYSSAFVPLTGSYLGASQEDAGMGACLVHLPDTSPLKHAGTGASDVGATVLYRYEDGELTDVPLWDVYTGQFPCGAQALGVNDLPDASCADVHTRLHVGTADCPFPAGYGQPVARADAGPPQAGNTYYLSPTGSNTASGTSAAPWKSFGYALPLLQPGDALVLLDGVYTPAANGRLAVSCGSAGARNGRPGSPIVVRADHEREAQLQGDGDRPFLDVLGCADWSFEGLYVTSMDKPNFTSADNTSVSTSTRVRLSKMVWSGENRYGNSNLVVIGNSSDITVEDSELYNFHATGLVLYVSSGCTLRRLYLNSRGRLDVAGGYTTTGPGGDEGISIYGWGTGHVVENCISEGSMVGFDLESSGGTAGNLVAGCIALSGWYGADLYNDGTDANQMLYGNGFVDFVAVDPLLYGLALEGTRSTDCSHCTFYRAVEAVRSQDSQTAGTGNHAGFLVDTLSIAPDGGGSLGLDLTALTGGGLGHVNTWGYATPYAPDASVAFSTMSVDPQLGACRVYLPTSSPMKGMGSDGGDIGANVLYRYRAGKLTSTPLWNPDGGSFPCGAIVAGLNDVPDASCFDVHRRLNVGVNGCAFPPEYGSATTDAGIGDGGPADAGRAGDGGVPDVPADAGPPDDGTGDGGPQTLLYRAVPCGCSQGGQAGLLWLAALLLAWRPRASRP